MGKRRATPEKVAHGSCTVSGGTWLLTGALAQPDTGAPSSLGGYCALDALFAQFGQTTTASQRDASVATCDFQVRSRSPKSDRSIAEESQSLEEAWARQCFRLLFEEGGAEGSGRPTAAGAAAACHTSAAVKDDSGWDDDDIWLDDDDEDATKKEQKAGLVTVAGKQGSDERTDEPSSCANVRTDGSSEGDKSDLLDRIFGADRCRRWAQNNACREASQA